MTFLSWLRNLVGAKPATPPTGDPFTGVRWVPGSENAFGVDLLDCESVSRSLLSTTQDPRAGESYTALRGSSGEEYRGRSPESASTCECDLRYPHKGETRDGPIFKAAVMEDKWDIYLCDGH